LKTGQLLLVALKFEGSAASKMQVRLRYRLFETSRIQAVSGILFVTSQ
jgi:hypothetical protein